MGNLLLLIKGGGERQIVDLLVEQIECADILVLNKMDMVDENQKVVLQEVPGKQSQLSDPY
eukprot:SAG31_NODE_1547_length_7925_cov_3.563251_6_plen_61_part_00